METTIWQPIIQVAISGLVMFGTQWIKRIQAIPINDGQKARIRSFTAVATFGLTAITAYLEGNLESVLSPEMIQVGAWSAVSWALAHFGYQGLIKKS